MNIEEIENLEFLNRKLILVRDRVRSVAMKYNHGLVLCSPEQFEFGFLFQQFLRCPFQSICLRSLVS